MKMTDKKAAGYFDSVRQCPVYEGDVYYEKGTLNPYYRVVKTMEKGFVVHHVGSTETFPLSTEGQFLIKRQYIGNEIDNPNVIKEFEAIPDSLKQYAEADTPEAETEEVAVAIAAANAEASSSAVEETEEVVFANTPLSDALEGISGEVETVEASENKEEIQTTVEKQTEISEEEIQAENSEIVEPANEEKGNDNEQICSTNSEEPADITEPVPCDTAAETNNDEPQQEEAGTDNAENSAEADDKPKSNVMVEVAKAAVPEVIANTEEEKKAILRVKTIKNCLSKNNDKIAEFKEKVEYHKNLASTLDFEPFVKLRNIVSEDLHTNVDEENLKGIKDRTKDFESIYNIQNLLKNHRRKAEELQTEICWLEEENLKLEEEKAEVEAKIDTFARQTKLALETAAK